MWAKNLEDAERLVANLAEERDRQLIPSSAGREQVGVQHELLTVSYVEVEPIRQMRSARRELCLPAHLFDRVLGLYRSGSPEDIRALGPLVVERAEKLKLLAGKGGFDPRPAVELAEKLLNAIDGSVGLGQTECGLLRAAVDYFLLVDDVDPDITSRTGFDDDRRVIDAVIHAIGKPARFSSSRARPPG